MSHPRPPGGAGLWPERRVSPEASQAVPLLQCRCVALGADAAAGPIGFTHTQPLVWA